jgi:hypothetical protein
MKETMLKRIPLMLLLVIQALGGGAITLAHARDAVVAPPSFEAAHEHCAVLHDELRCALCHYASARVITQHGFTLATPRTAIRFVAVQRVVAVVADVRRTAPARAPPQFLS